ncbi:FAD-dependent oxidoreductase [Papillibacter cinnamivorans]|uniref:NADPH-dependent glutamate synthase beta chain n=1 Tax=Papillibacter cinnamivorans DSM 12816 TaxID=1122930 RepID=A0A1W2C740_9FIRM|nr:FAD-dependent oxidoreductase [Papillibacter cinnamivorans]SMC80692.1 NADPH-dependent glutamate synthase beta chain [Papillibacter cinnamivorans DSM 12816]
MSKDSSILIRMDEGREFLRPRGAVAVVDSEMCFNCGVCRRACPTEAIGENQRDICRLCPDCTPKPKMFPEESKEYATRHACSLGCPLGTVPEGYVRAVADGKFDIAYDLISELNPLPSVCSMICHHPCEEECKRGLLIDEPIAIRALKRFIVSKVPPKTKRFDRKYDMKIAVIGAGPAGLTAAADLAAKGYRVKIFEAGPEPGGMLRRGIPSFRIDREIMDEEIKALLEAGIEIEYNCMVGKNPTVDSLFDDKYAAVVIAVGAGKGTMLPIPGTGAEKVYDAVSFMRRVNARQPVLVGKKAVVLGGGSVAMDTARALRRMGLEVACACIENGECVPAPAWELKEAKEEGVEIIEAACPSRIVTELFTVKGVELKKVCCIGTDSCGRLRPETEAGSEWIVEADTVVFATGQKADVRFLSENAGLKLDEAGRIEYDPETMQTSREKVYIAGDAVAARGSVIDAMASGRKAALAVDNLLQGRSLEDRAVKRDPALAPNHEKIFPAVRLEKLGPQSPPMKPERDGFDLVEGVFDEKTAVLEAKRCMKCGYSSVDPDKCIGCGVCANLCPARAITMAAVK